MSKCLVTGGAGFIGSHVVDELLKEGHDVFALDDLSGGFRLNVDQKAHFIDLDICNNEALAHVFAAEKFDYVFHLAAYAAENYSHHIRRFNYKNNLIGSAILINLSIRHAVKRFVFTSSAAVYGAGRGPMDPYGIAKMAVEMDLSAARDKFGLEYVIFRPHNVYGPRQNLADPYRNVIGIFMNQIMQDKPVTIFGDGLQKRAFSYVGDVAPYIARSIEAQNNLYRTFDVGSDFKYTINELVDMLEQVSGERIEREHLEKRHEAEDVPVDHGLLKSYFDVGPETLLNEGLLRMWKWALENGPAPRMGVPAPEVDSRLPEGWR